eukprot:scaffold4841_cov259-Ochromonas_danica.AAC.15
MALDDSPLGRSLAIYVGCNQNGMEALIYFPACLLSALSVRVDKEIIESAAGLFLTLRVIYTAIYLSSLNGPLRTVICACTSLRLEEIQHSQVMSLQALWWSMQACLSRYPPVLTNLPQVSQIIFLGIGYDVNVIEFMEVDRILTMTMIR